MVYANCIPRVRCVLNFKQCKLDSGFELSSLMSRSSAFCSGTENHEFGGSPTKLTSRQARLHEIQR